MPRNDDRARAGRRPPVERRHLAARRAAVADLDPAKLPASLQDKQRQAEAASNAPRARSTAPRRRLSPASLDFAVAEIAARQNELDNPAAHAMPPRSAPPIMPAAPAVPVAPIAPAGPDFSSLERHLFKITSQIEALQRPDGIEQSIAAFRAELAEIRPAITEAMPRRAIESIENEIRSLSRRIDDNRQSAAAIDGQALANIERALSEIREVLRSLTSAEQLAGYDEAIRNLGAKLDMILRANDDPGTVQQLESAISALRGIVSNVASNDALARLSEDVHLLSSKVDQLTRNGNPGDYFAALEQRIIAALTSALESRERPATSDTSEQLEGALRALSDRIDRMQVGNDGAAAFAHLEQRVSYLLERLEASSDPRAGNLGRVEDGLQDILRHLENQHAAFAELAESGRNARPPQAPAPAAGHRPDRSGQARIVRHPLQPDGSRPPHPGFAGGRSLHARPCGRSAGDDRRRPAHGPPRIASAGGADHVSADRICAHRICADRISAARARAGSVCARGRDPAAGQARTAQSRRGASAFRRRPARFPRQRRRATVPDAPPPLPAPPRAISEILRAARRQGGAPRDRTRIAARSSARAGHAAERPHALAIGAHRRVRRRHQRNPGGAAPAGVVIELHRRRAPRRAGRRGRAAATRRAARRRQGQRPRQRKTRTSKEPSTLTTKIRSLLVGASVVVIVLGTFKMAMTLLDGSGSNPPPMPAAENSAEPQPAAQSPADGADKPAAPDQVTPSMTSPTPIGRQSLNNIAADRARCRTRRSTSRRVRRLRRPPTTSPARFPPPQAAANGRRFGTVQVPPSEKLPDTIGGPALRAAALKGDADRGL